MLVREEIPMFELRPPKHFGLPWENNYYGFHFDVVEQVIAHARKTPLEFIYQRMSIANYSGVSISRRLRVPLILEYNGSEAWVARNWGRPLRHQKLAETVEDACLKHAHLVVTISDVLRDELIERGIPAERIVSYPNCIDAEFINPARFRATQLACLRDRHGISQSAKVVTFLGTFGQWHGAEILAQAIRYLHDSEPSWFARSEVHFLFVGNGLRMPEVKAALGEIASGPSVTLAGLVPQAEAPAYLAMSDVLASPHVANEDGSKFFGSPTKLFEYLAMERAIIASELDQIGEILAGSDHVDSVSGDGNAKPREGAVALLTEPGNVQKLAQGIQFLVDNQSWRLKIGKNARQLALSRYTWRHHVTEIIDRARHLDLVG